MSLTPRVFRSLCSAFRLCCLHLLHKVPHDPMKLCSRRAVAPAWEFVAAEMLRAMLSCRPATQLQLILAHVSGTSYKLDVVSNEQVRLFVCTIVAALASESPSTARQRRDNKLLSSGWSVPGHYQHHSVRASAEHTWFVADRGCERDRKNASQQHSSSYCRLFSLSLFCRRGTLVILNIV